LPEELKALGSLEKRIHKVKGEQGVRKLIERVKGVEKKTKPEVKGSI
jgi:threonine synthase